MKTFLSGKRILVTGACGTIGNQLVEMLLEENYQIAELVGIDNNERGLFFLEHRYLANPTAIFYLADIRDRDALAGKMKGIDIVFHAAAYKHVALCERSPYEAVQTNINGVQNVIWAAQETGVEKVIFTSSDKAVNPTNVMGTSKLMGERLMTAANSNSRGGGPLFASTRFGNVLGSSGSVVPIFHRQISTGGPVTLTHSDMTRFVMSIEEAVRLVIESSEIARGGGVFITKMPVVRIKDLAEVMIDELAPGYGFQPEEIRIEEIGTKPGEKLYEELMSREEMRRTVELPKFYVVLPAFRGIYRNIEYDYEDLISERLDSPYNSANEKPLSKNSLLKLLKDYRLLEIGSISQNAPAKRYWPGEDE